jgi:hypothetical protein
MKRGPICPTNFSLSISPMAHSNARDKLKFVGHL